ncbi:MAG: hypothetical protein WCA32_08080, partial [Chromatiaceae bacterium]
GRSRIDTPASDRVGAIRFPPIQEPHPSLTNNSHVMAVSNPAGELVPSFFQFGDPAVRAGRELRRFS